MAMDSIKFRSVHLMDDGDGHHIFCIDGDGDGHDVDGGQPLSPEETANVILVEDIKPSAQILFPQPL